MNVSRRFLLLAGSSFLLPLSEAYAIDACSIEKAKSGVAYNVFLSAAALAATLGGSAYLLSGLYAAGGAALTVGAVTISPALLAGLAVGAGVVAAYSLYKYVETANMSKELCGNTKITGGLMIKFK